MTTAFRNVDAQVSDPVESWPTEAIQAALERGSLREWRRLAAAISQEPWGPVARRVEAVLGYSRPYGVAELMESVIARARGRAEARERSEVAGEIEQILVDSGLTRQQFAAMIGTSASRLSTYLSGRVTPSASLMVRMRRVGVTNRE